ncbi:class I SAM-dependent methyltransferase [Nocardioides sp.]|uniref:class I SAM-dependent methyltransferase n=1 Tax=Nocardioides sp. TaxID=35761 RepID=UPI00356275A1
MSDEQEPFAASGSRAFGTVARAYDRGRPSYPREAARWLVGDQPRTVLELGAGTGKLTDELVALGHDVHATDLDAEMLAVLQQRLPDVRTTLAPAEEIPLADRSVDVVVCAQAFHWFDSARALPEIARVLKPGGSLALAWNQPDQRIPWVRRLGALIGNQDQVEAPAEPLIASTLFGFVDEETFRFWQQVDRRTIQDLALSRSNILSLAPEAQEAKLAEVLAFYDDYGRGMDGMQLPYTARCFKARVVTPPGASGPRAHSPEGTEADADPTRPEPGATGEFDVSDGTDTDMLLIDFR